MEARRHTVLHRSLRGRPARSRAWRQIMMDRRAVLIDLEASVRQLPARDLELLEDRYGLDQEPPALQTFRALAPGWGVSPEQLYDWEQRAFTRLLRVLGDEGKEG